MTKYNRRLVVRDTLTDLELGIAFLERDGWEIDPTVPEENSANLLFLLKKIRLQNGCAGITVAMRKQITDG